MAEPRSFWVGGFLNLVEGRAYCASLCFCGLHTAKMPRTDPLVQVDYVRVIVLILGLASICTFRLITILDLAHRTR